MSKIILMDWQRGKIPYYSLPPDYKGKDNIIEEVNNIEENDKNKEFGLEQNCDEIPVINDFEANLEKLNNNKI
jgi:hypothetical protein